MHNWRPIVKMPGTSLSASKRVVGPRQAGLLAPDHCRWAPSQGTASVDLAHGSSVTVTGSRRIRTGFPFQLASSHVSVVLTLWNARPASPPPKGDRIIGRAERGPATAWESGEKIARVSRAAAFRCRVVRYLRRRAIARSRLPTPRWSG